ncbi:MAG: tetraacyldisaccharide 4'-kinase, partial [Muribaculaceae bacterium]|nr:tetraacyldisaccharide 4'-kinase [Muribaculaceae bacterium]
TVQVDIFPDHHQYTRKDINHILERYRSLKGNQRIIITTEKDAVRMAANPYFPHELKAITYYLPIEVEFNAGHNPQQPIEEVIEKMLKDRNVATLR